MIENFFPSGIHHFIGGGVIIGIAVVFMFIFTGRRVGASTFFTSTLAYISKKTFFHGYDKERLWRLLFSIGLIIGGGIYALTTASYFVTTVQWWRLLIGGILVGIGTRLGRGCTSGHGICGLGSLAKPSFVSTITFLAIAIITALTIQFFGVTP